MPVEELLARLVGFNSVVGTPNAPIVDFVRNWFVTYGIEPHILLGPEGDRSNIFATIGPKDRPGYILSGHLDVVPAKEPQWLADPFVMRLDGERMIGRGTCDMKGYVAAMLSLVPDLVQMDLATPIHFALSYDEEAGGRGAPHMIARIHEFCAPPVGCIVGEPSGLAPVLRHKGKTAIRVVATGKPGHSSRTDLGVNAIHMLRPAIDAVVDLTEALKTGPLDPAFEPPWSTMQIGVIHGGEAINIIPEHAWMDIEARAIAGVSPDDLLQPIIELAATVGLSSEKVSSYPPLAMEEGADLAVVMEGLAGKPSIAAVSYGTEAGLFQQAGIPTIICGPGDISRAHKPEEFLTRKELADTRALLLRLAERGVA